MTQSDRRGPRAPCSWTFSKARTKTAPQPASGTVKPSRPPDPEISSPELVCRRGRDVHTIGHEKHSRRFLGVVQGILLRTGLVRQDLAGGLQVASNRNDISLVHPESVQFEIASGFHNEQAMVAV